MQNRLSKVIWGLCVAGMLMSGISACGSTSGAVQENTQKMEDTQESYQQIWEKQIGYQENITIDTLTISVCQNDIVEDIRMFEGEDACYFFLPSYADTRHIRFNASPDQYTIIYQGIECNPEKEMEELLWNESGTLVLKNMETGVEESREVVFLKSENINTMYIKTSSGSLEQIHEDKEYKEAGNMTLYTVDGVTDYHGSLDYISGRGNQTWDLDKRPYQIKLEKKTDLLGMGKAKKWILLSNTLDDSFIRNKIVYDMAAAAGLAYSPESEFLDLYINGEYLGNYQISEKIEIDPERVDIRDLATETELLNKDIDFESMQPHESEDQNEKWIDMENDPEDITGGYLLERDYWEKYGPERCGFKTTLREHFVVKSPGNASRAEVEYIREVVQQLEDAIYAEDGVNPNTGIYYTDYLDMESWAKKYIVEEFTKNEGAGTTSSWFYKPDASESNRIYAGPVWDYDKSLGRYEPSCYRDPVGLSYLSYHHYSSPWYKQLYSHEDYREAVKKYYQEDFQDYLRELVEYRIDEYAETVRASAYMDHIRWSSLCDFWMFDDFDESIAYLKDFISKRTDFLDEVWVEDKIYYMVKFKVEGAIYEAQYLEPGEVMEEIPDLSEDYDNILGWYVEGTDEPFDVTMPIGQDYTLYLKTEE